MMQLRVQEEGDSCMPCNAVGSSYNTLSETKVVILKNQIQLMCRWVISQS